MGLLPDIKITINNHGADPAVMDKLNKLMALTEAQFNEVLSRIDTATSTIATKITDLQEEIKGAGLPESVEQSVLTRLGTIATTLEGLAKDPENPTPEEPTDPDQPAQ